jgi:hypothetical protein
VERIVSGPSVIHILEFVKEHFYSGALEGSQQGLQKEERLQRLFVLQ